MTAPEEPQVVDLSVLRTLTDRLGDRAAAFREQLIATWQTETAKRLAELDEAVERQRRRRTSSGWRTRCAVGARRSVPSGWPSAAR